jgi:hypothetical protein
MVFGKTLNLTVASVMFSLVFWTLLWGISGAILSVPFLSLMKILLVEADHPWAKLLVDWIREDPTVDEAREMAKAQTHRELRVSSQLGSLLSLSLVCTERRAFLAVQLFEGSSYLLCATRPSSVLTHFFV